MKRIDIDHIAIAIIVAIILNGTGVTQRIIDGLSKLLEYLH